MNNIFSKEFQNVILELLRSYSNDEPDDFDNYAYAFFLQKNRENHFEDDPLPIYKSVDWEGSVVSFNEDMKPLEGLIINKISKTLLFKRLNRIETKNILKEVKYITLNESTILIKKGEKVQHMYIVSKGVFFVWKETSSGCQLLKVWKDEGYMGDLDVLRDRGSEVNVTAETCGAVWALPAGTLRRLARKKSQQQSEECKAVLRSLPGLGTLSPALIDRISWALVGIVTRSGECLAKRNELAEGLQVLLQGRAVVKVAAADSRNEVKVCILGPGNSIELPSLFNGQPQMFSVYSVGRAGVAYLSRKAFLRVIGEDCARCLQEAFASQQLFYSTNQYSC